MNTSGPQADGVDEDDFDEQMEQLEALSRHLGLRCGKASSNSSSLDLEVLRPTTAGTTASASTTAASSTLAITEMDATLGESSGRSSCASGDPFEDLRGAERVHYELQKVTLPHGCHIKTSAGSAAQLFFDIDVSEGPYAPVTLSFWIKIFDEYPDRGSLSVRCTSRIFHPSVDAETRRVEIPQEQLGGTDASVASHGSIRGTLMAIRSLILSPSDAHVANSDAAMLLQADPDEFRRTVRATLLGGEYQGSRFDRVVKPGGSSHGTRSLPLTEVPSRAATPLQANLSLQMMGLEVSGRELRAMASAYQHENTVELRCLE